MYELSQVDVQCVVGTVMVVLRLLAVVDICHPRSVV